jgi:hypothetical protein
MSRGKRRVPRCGVFRGLVPEQNETFADFGELTATEASEAVRRLDQE